MSAGASSDGAVRRPSQSRRARQRSSSLSSGRTVGSSGHYRCAGDHPVGARPDFERPIRGLNPEFEIEDRTVVMATQLIVGMSLRNLGPVVIGLGDHRHTVVGAIDMLILEV